MTRLLAWLATQATTHPVRVLLTVVVPALLLTATTARVPVDLSFTGIVPWSHPLVERYVTVTEQVNLSGRMPLLLEGPEAELDAAVDTVTQVMLQDPGVVAVYGRPPEQWVAATAPYLVEPELFDAWIRGAAGGDNDALGAVGQALSDQRDALAPPAGSRVLIVEQSVDPLTVPVGEADALLLQDALDDALSGTQVSGELTGIAILAAQDAKNTTARLRWLTPLSLVLVLGVLSRFERRPLHLLALAAPMVLALGATLGVVGNALGTLTIMESVFGILVFGLGVDFGLHLSMRVREEQADGRSLADAIHVAWTGTGSGVLAGALTTGLAFAVLVLTPDPSMRHLGLSGSVGLVTCLIAMLTVLPAMWVLLERKGAVVAAPTVSFPGVEPLASASARRPAWALVAAAVLIAGALSGVGRFHYETDLTQVFNRDMPAKETLARVQAQHGINLGPWVSLAADMDQLRTRHASFDADPAFVEVVSLHQVLRPDRAERHRTLVDAQSALATRHLSLTRLMAMPLAPRGALEQGAALVQVLLDAAQSGPPELDSLPAAVVAPLTTRDGGLLVLAYGESSGLDAALARSERRAGEVHDPRVVGFAMLLELLLSGDDPWVVPAFSGVVGVVLVVLAVDLRSVRLYVLALAPVVFGVTVTLGVLCWTGMGFNVMTFLVVPLIVGLGVDDGIHVVHRLRESPSLPAWKATASVGQAIVLTTLTTVASFVVMLFTNHPGFQGMAKVLVLGVPLCLLGSITLIPALDAVLPGKRS